MKIIPGAVLVITLMAGTSVQAADFAGPSRYCRFVEDASELVNYTSLRDLKLEVHSRYQHAAEVSSSRQAVWSQSPLYLWAGQAKISCARSYGYLRKRRKWRKRPDYTTLQKCECFYQRMLAYLPR